MKSLSENHGASKMNAEVDSNDKVTRRKSWCPANDPCRYCKDYQMGGTLRQACEKRPRGLKIPRRGKKNKRGEVLDDEEFTLKTERLRKPKEKKVEVAVLPKIDMKSQ